MGSRRTLLCFTNGVAIALLTGLLLIMHSKNPIDFIRLKKLHINAAAARRAFMTRSGGIRKTSAAARSSSVNIVDITSTYIAYITIKNKLQEQYLQS